MPTPANSLPTRTSHSSTKPARSRSASRLDAAAFTVASVETRTFTEKPKAPFITSTLQQEAGRKLGFSAGRTMSIAQGLYERGLITYMRTDSTTLSEQAVSAARRQITSLYGGDFLPDQPREYRSKVKNAQEAHEAIRPAGDQMRTPDDADSELRSSDERRLYDLIWKRTVASQMADARIRRVTLRLGATSSAGEEVVFQASGRTIEFAGYLRAYVEGADDPEAELEDRETLLPPLEEQQSVRCAELRPSGHTTQPPARFTEASLVKELEERGIGRPSTYVSVIETILARDYVFKKGSALVPTWKAFAKVQLLERHFAHLIDYDFTATMEEALDAVARGEGEAEKWLDAFYFGNGQAGLRELVSDERLAQIDMAEVNAVHIGADPQGNELTVRVWPNGARIERGDEKAPIPVDLAPDELTPAKAEELLAKGGGGPRDLGADPTTGLTVLVLNGRFGPFVQLGEQEPGSKDKPPRASLFASMEPDTVTLGEALQLLSLPRVVGVDTDGEEITAQNGRYGPYIKKGTDSRSIDSEDQLFSVTLPEAQAIFAQPKQRRGRVAKPPIADLGPHPESGAPVRVLDGRFGPYITDGTTNATVPRGIQPEAVTMTEAVDLLAERAAAWPHHEEGDGEEVDRQEVSGEEVHRQEGDREEDDGKEGARQAGDEEGDHAARSGPRSRVVGADDRRAASARGAVHPFRCVGAADARRAVAGLRQQDLLPALDRGGRLEPRRLDRPHRDPRHRRAGVRQLGCRGQLGHDDPRAAGLPPRHRRRRHHRPLRPPQGHGAVRHRSGEPPRAPPVRRQPRWVAADLVGARDPHAPLGSGAGGHGAEHRRRGVPVVGELALTRRQLRHVPDRRDHLLAARGCRHRHRRLRHHLVVQGRPGSARTHRRRDDVPRVGDHRLPVADSSPRSAPATGASTGPKPSARSRKVCGSSASTR